jgi:signal transduction histidine kinase
MSTASSNSQLPPLDTLTTRFLILFVLLLAVPILSVILFTRALISEKLAQHPEQMTRLLENFNEGSSTLLVLGLLASGVIALVTSRTITGPLRQLMNDMEQITQARHWQHQVAVRGVHEIQALTHRFNALLARLQTDEEMRTDLITTLAHDLRVPLLAEKQMLAFWQQGRFGPVNTEQHTLLETMARNNQDCLQMMTTLLDVHRLEAQGQAMPLETVSLPSLVREALEALEPLIEARSLQTHIELPAVLTVEGNPAELRRVLLNLLSNAIRYAQTRVTVAVGSGPPVQYFTPISEQPHPITALAWLVVKDDGPGFPPEAAQSLFQRFSHDRRTPVSLGLGLYFCKQVMDRHQGWVWVESDVGQGSAVTLAWKQAE